MVKRSFLQSFLLLGALAAPFAGCSGKVIGVSGGETNWLASCASDASCDSGQRCLCGVCTKECTNDATCAGAPCATQGTSVFASACPNEPTIAGVCLASCASSSDCKGDLTCVDSACMRPPLRIEDASMGTGGSGGGAGDGGGRRGGESNHPPLDGSVSTGGSGPQPVLDGAVATLLPDGGRAGCEQIPNGSGQCVLASCAGGSCAPCYGPATPAFTGATSASCSDDTCDPNCRRFAGNVPAETVIDHDASDGSITKSYTYEAQCAAGLVPHWESFSYSADRPAGSRIAIVANLHLPEADAGNPSVPVPLATLTDGSSPQPDTCSLYGPHAGSCPTDLGVTFQHSMMDWSDVALEFTLVPSSNGFPSVSWWELRYTCLDPFDGTCDYMGKKWANGTSGLHAEACDYVECKDGALAELNTGCVTPICGCDAQHYAGPCVDHDGSFDEALGRCGTCWDGEVTLQRGALCVCRDDNPAARCLGTL